MSANLVETWEQFRSVLNLYSNIETLLNPPCSPAQMSEAEGRLNFTLPQPLKTLLALNNGQRVDDKKTVKGIFKSLSGWDVYERHVFLGLDEIGQAYKAFVDDQVLVAEFGTSEIPFAIAVFPVPFKQTPYKEAFCINSSTGLVSLIWTQHIDPMNPSEWQVARFRRAASLAEFIEKQIVFYW